VKISIRVSIDYYFEWHPVFGEVLMYQISQTGGPESYGEPFEVTGFGDSLEATAYAEKHGWIVE